MAQYSRLDALTRSCSGIRLVRSFLVRRIRVRCGWPGILILVAGLSLLGMIWTPGIEIALPPKISFNDDRYAPTGPNPASKPNHLSLPWNSNGKEHAIDQDATSSVTSQAGFHLLIPASESTPELCKTLLSAIVLDYPAPVIINFNKSFDHDSWDRGTHVGKIQGVHDFVKNDPLVQPDDVILVIDGYDVWFQLPPEVVISRYSSTVGRANELLKSKYGTQGEHTSTPNDAKKTQKYTAKVLFAADKLCWPNAIEDPACQAVPPSTLPSSAWGANTDRDPDGFQMRPRFLNSGTVIGTAESIDKVYQHAMYKVTEQERGSLGDQFVFAEIFGEQEFRRKQVTGIDSRNGQSGRWKIWLASRLGKAKKWTNTTSVIPNNITVVDGQDYEYGIGLDYEMGLFQTMTHSHEDIDYLYYNGAVKQGTTLTRPSFRPRSLSLPTDISSLPRPFASHKPQQKFHDPSPSAEEAASTSPVDLSAIPVSLNWTDIRLATNLHVPTVPALLHFNGDKSYLKTWWPKMWYHSHARALLRRYVQSPPPPTPGPVQASITNNHADGAVSGTHPERGGKGGVWTDDGRWFSWGEMCGGWEEEVFGDGLGRWGREDGSEGKTFDSWGKVVSDVEIGIGF